MTDSITQSRAFCQEENLLNWSGYARILWVNRSLLLINKKLSIKKRGACWTPLLRAFPIQPKKLCLGLKNAATTFKWLACLRSEYLLFCIIEKVANAIQKSPAIAGPRLLIKLFMRALRNAIQASRASRRSAKDTNRNP